ncbi:hypothetical protein LXA43DRAFT_892236 [Ganoderma leucocontextum]|nr:hypothetical protein LXA43DRAFT_892236 [Ganoderma leucocontextum]
MVALHPPVQVTLGWRKQDFQPDFWDYKEYQRRAYAILSQPKGRAALLRGGIVWRLALEILGAGPSVELAQQGPSSDVWHYGQAFVPSRGDASYDDALSSDELDVICGVYKVYTANNNFSQTQDYSWWPKAGTWEDSDLDMGYWTPYCEEWFQQRLRRIWANDTEPRTAKKWKDGLKRHKLCRRFRDVVDLASVTFLEQELRVPHPTL